MDLLNIVASLVATILVTGVLHFVVQSRRTAANASSSDVADTALALLFVFLFVVTMGWFASALMPAFSSAPIGLTVSGITYVGAIASTLYVLGLRSRGASMSRP